MELEYLVFAAHPDDAELSMGGTIAKLINAGKSVGIIDLTQGELGTRGNIETRQNEANAANNILGITERVNLKIPDGAVFVNETNTLSIIKMIRKYKPKIIFAPYINDRHPDHIETSKLIKRAYFLSGLPKVKTELNGEEQESYRPKKLFYYAQTYEFEPSFIVDISNTFRSKIEAMKAYKTQFHNQELKDEGPETFISTPEFLQFIESRAKSFGFKIGKEYGEPFYSEEYIELDINNYLENSL